MTELETLAVVWVLNHFHAYLYGNEVTIYTDHSAVKAVLETPNPSASGVKNILIVYRSGRENLNADALSRNPQGAAPEAPQMKEVQVATINSEEERIVHLLNKSVQQPGVQEDFSAEQQKDKELNDVIQFLTEGSLPDDDKAARKIGILATSLAVVDGILYFVDSKRDHRRRCAVPSQ